MKNIEKYQRTNDALDAWRQSVKGGLFLSFDEWAQWEYEAMRVPTLLEAAEAVVNEWYATDVSGGNIVNLKNAIAREKAKPVRNCDRYKTAREAWSAFVKMCNATKCEKCQFYNPDDISCRFNWLYAEAEKEVK